MKEATEKEKAALKRFLKLKATDVPEEKRELFKALEKPLKALIKQLWLTKKQKPKRA